jgi:hypothetical protein
MVVLVAAMMLASGGFIAFITVWRDAPSRDPGLALRPAMTGERLEMARRETRPTLDPAQFTGKAALAYQVAREIPEVLDQLQCYCACRSQYGHVSLLSCYVDGHGST